MGKYDFYCGKCGETIGPMSHVNFNGSEGGKCEGLCPKHAKRCGAVIDYDHDGDPSFLCGSRDIKWWKEEPYCGDHIPADLVKHRKDMEENSLRTRLTTALARVERQKKAIEILQTALADLPEDKANRIYSKATTALKGGE